LGHEIVRYAPKFKDQILDLQKNLWSPSLALNAAYFEWKYERNPYLADPLIYLAISDGSVVGMRGFFGIQWEAGSAQQKFRCLYADDSVVAPEHRRGGLIHRIMEAAFKDLDSQGYEYVFNLSAGPAIFRQSLSTGWRNVGYMQPMRWRPWAVTLQRGLHRILRQLPSAAHGLDVLVFRWFEKRRRSLADIDQEQPGHSTQMSPRISFANSPRCQAMADLVERIGSSNKIRHVRDPEYFDWRFQNPLSRYRFLFHGKNGLEGYLVLQEYTSEFADKEVLNIVDWEGTTPTVKVELLQAARHYAANRVLSTWAATLPIETVTMLKAEGFAKPGQRQEVPPPIPALLVRSVRDENLESDWMLGGGRLSDLADWDLRLLYSMHG
jgi:GNAT superfamily N-acetyltransferase